MPQGSIKSSVWLIGAGLAILVVGYLAATLVPRTEKADAQYAAQLQLAQDEIQALTSAVEIFHSRYGRYPTALDELVHPPSGAGDNRQIVSRIPSDPWGQPIQYKLAADGSSFNFSIPPAHPPASP